MTPQDDVKKAVAAGESLTEAQALTVLNWPDEQLSELLALATSVREIAFGKAAHCCSIMNLKSGRCSEDCGFCAQSAHYGGKCEIYGIRSAEEVAEARSEYPAGLPGHFSLVTSGRGMKGAELARVCELVKAQPQRDALPWCASLGILGPEEFAALYEAGVRRYHHNLEAPESFFPQVCTTHSYQDRVDTVRAAKAAGMEVCCGGLFGLGESPEQRVELALALRDLDIDSIPLNFLVPIEGTPIAGRARPLTREEILRVVAMVRLGCRTPEVRVCGGREHYFPDGGRELFEAGATGMMIGGYLTVRGRTIDSDLAMLNEIGLEVS